MSTAHKIARAFEFSFVKAMRIFFGITGGIKRKFQQQLPISKAAKANVDWWSKQPVGTSTGELFGHLESAIITFERDIITTVLRGWIFHPSVPTKEIKLTNTGAVDRVCICGLDRIDVFDAFNHITNAKLSGFCCIQKTIVNNKFLLPDNILFEVILLDQRIIRGKFNSVDATIRPTLPWIEPPVEALLKTYQKSTNHTHINFKGRIVSFETFSSFCVRNSEDFMQIIFCNEDQRAQLDTSSIQPSPYFISDVTLLRQLFSLAYPVAKEILVTNNSILEALGDISDILLSVASNKLSIEHTP